MSYFCRVRGATVFVSLMYEVFFFILFVPETKRPKGFVAYVLLMKVLSIRRKHRHYVTMAALFHYWNFHDFRRGYSLERSPLSHVRTFG